VPYLAVLLILEDGGLDAPALEFHRGALFRLLVIHLSFSVKRHPLPASTFIISDESV
jgi:hypothetical protein